MIDEFLKFFIHMLTESFLFFPIVNVLIAITLLRIVFYCFKLFFFTDSDETNNSSSSEEFDEECDDFLSNEQIEDNMVDSFKNPIKDNKWF